LGDKQGIAGRIHFNFTPQQLRDSTDKKRNTHTGLKTIIGAD
jgi:hypothetical protein